MVGTWGPAPCLGHRVWPRWGRRSPRRLLPGAGGAGGLGVGLPRRLGPGRGPPGPQPRARRLSRSRWGFKHALPTPARPLQPRFVGLHPLRARFQLCSLVCALKPPPHLCPPHLSSGLCRASAVAEGTFPTAPLLGSLCTHSHICSAPHSDRRLQLLSRRLLFARLTSVPAEQPLPVLGSRCCWGRSIWGAGARARALGRGAWRRWGRRRAAEPMSTLPKPWPSSPDPDAPETGSAATLQPGNSPLPHDEPVFQFPFRHLRRSKDLGLVDFSPSPGLCLLSFSNILRASASPLGGTPEEEGIGTARACFLLPPCVSY